jgi:hypothetical protein
LIEEITLEHLEKVNILSCMHVTTCASAKKWNSLRTRGGASWV